ncbi:MAG: chemoreceptor glutamine deamidase CheD [Pseudomonadota bacterium]
MNIPASPTSNRYFEAKIGAYASSVFPGNYLVISTPGEAVTTLLGSCVAACVRDTRTGIGGLNHFLLPEEDSGNKSGFSSRYGVYAMELLINEILKRGGTRESLEAKAFGGSRVIETSAQSSVGNRNVSFVKEYLDSEGIALSASDLGGGRARRVFFFPDSGRVVVQRLPMEDNKHASDQDAKLQTHVKQAKPAGGVELF